MKILFLMALLSLLAFTHPFARDGSVETSDTELWRERIERARENEKALENISEKQKQEESESEEDFDVTRSDKEKAEDLVR